MYAPRSLVIAASLAALLGIPVATSAIAQQQPPSASVVPVPPGNQPQTQSPAAIAVPAPAVTVVPGAQLDRPADGTAAAAVAPPVDAAARDSGVLGTPGDPPDNRHVGYYYPPITSTEIYVARVDTMPAVDRAKRIGFATLISRGLLSAPYRPPYAVFAKGSEADKMIIVGMVDGELNTIFRVRALLANLTTQSRLTQVFQENTVAENATFLDFLKMFGFRNLSVSDGVKLTHQITIR